MPKVEEVKVLNIDETPYAVDGMSEEIQALVAVYNEWNQKLADARDNFAMIQAATNDLSRSIILKVREEKEAAEADEGETAEAPAEESSSEAPAAE